MTIPRWFPAVFPFVFCLLVTAVDAEDAETPPQVKLVRADNQVSVTIGGKPFAVYRFGKDQPKPYFFPVRGPEGTVMTRPISKPGDKQDHPHHKGIWLAVDEVNEVKFWAEKGKIETAKVEVLEASGDVAKFRVVNHWNNLDGKTEVTERTTITIWPNRLLEYDITFDAEQGDVVFADTKEGLFGFRMVDSMRENEGGTVENSDGKKGTKECWGQTADWVDYYGNVEGKTLGVAIFDHPENFRKSRYHVRNYGLFSISPFGEKAYAKQPANEKHLKKGEKLKLTYAMYLHAGSTKEADVAGVYKKWLTSRTDVSEANIKRLLSELAAITKELKTVSDAKTAAAALPKVKKVCDQIEKLKKEDEKNKIRKSQIEKLKKKYEKQLTATGMALGVEFARIQKVAGGEAINQRVREMLLNLQ